MEQILLVKYGEIILKGLNRPYFEDVLIKNIRTALRGYSVKIWLAQATVYVKPSDDKFDEITEILTKVFGITSITKAYVLPKDMEGIKKGTEKCLYDVLSAAKSFKVEAKRADKKFPLKSPDICAELGGYLYEAFDNLKVDVKNPEKTVMVEIREQNAYVYCDRVKGRGGMPVGTNSRALLLLSGGIDSPAAGYMVAKRGVSIDALHFFSHPYTSERAKEKVLELASILSVYTGGMKVHIVPFTDIQLEIKKKCPEEYLTIIMRRFMMRIAAKVAENNNIKALVTGESIGQVASQTVEALFVTDSVVNMPVFRPVIGLDKEEIVKIAKDIGTFETSILPYEDCCTVFTPRHPNTKPRIEKVIHYESVLETEKLVSEAADGIETIII